jgi:serine/threonine protein kinase
MKGKNDLTIFNTALEITAPAERAAYLDQACGSDSALREKVISLLAAYEKGGDSFDGLVETRVPAGPAGPSAPEGPGSIIGRYKLLQRIGEGGMGVVYMAEQEEPVRRRVALKIIKFGMDTKQVVARFEAERQALAMMDHPNIAKVLDAGATETGRPYFVMELVRGIKITEYSDQSELSTAERLNLFLQVCRAIQHAHQKGIIHRDLKPSNILVTVNDPGSPAVPKVIDFGIAKATAGRLTNKTVFTELHQFIGTPAYMSPEQAEMTSLDIDTRSDIYSLGVLLYELLTGGTPFDQQELAKVGLDTMRQTIRSKEPPRPSTRLSTLAPIDLSAVARARRSEPPKLIHLVRGDLDWIVMKCLEKDRARRYETANGLGMDLQRHLNNEPVIARPPSASYRFQKFVRRNKMAFAATSAVAASLWLGLGVSTWMFLKEKSARQEQEHLRQEADLARANETRQRRQAQANEATAQSEAAKNQHVAQLLKDMLNIGRSAALGRDTKLLQEMLTRAADRFGRELKDQPEVEGELLSIVGGTYFDLGRYLEAEATYRRALAIYQQKPFGPEHPLAALASARLAVVLGYEQNAEKLTEAEALAREALRVRRTLPGDHTNEVAQSLVQVAELLHQRALSMPDADSKMGQLRQAESMLREAIDNLHKSGIEALVLADAIRSLAVNLRSQGKLADAEARQREELALEIRLAGGEEHLGVAGSFLNLGDLLTEEGKGKEGETWLTKGLALRRKLLGDDHVEVGYAWAHLAACLQRQGRLAEVEPAAREALRIWVNGFGPTHTWTIGILNQLVGLLREEGKPSEAETVLREELAALSKLPGSEHGEMANVLTTLAHVLRDEGKLDEAEATLREALDIRRELRTRGVPPRDAQAQPTMIDLSAFYNAALKGSWHGNRPDNDLAELPMGVQGLAGTAFEVRGLVQLSGGRWESENFPDQVLSIPVAQKCHRVFFLHACLWGFDPDGTVIGKYVLHFRDGGKEERPLVLGLDLLDWWKAPESGAGQWPQVAWSGFNGASRKEGGAVHLFKTTWENPHPENEISSIDLVSTKQTAAPFLVAITLE